MHLRLLCLLAALLAPQVFGVPHQKAKVVGNNQLDALSDKGDTGKAKVVNEGDVKLDYQGKGGLIKNKGGSGEATQQGKGDKFNAIGPDGKKATGTVDKKTKKANILDARGNKVVADGSNDKLIDAKVNNKDDYHVVRDSAGNAQVFPKNSPNPAHSISNLREGTDKIDVQTPNKKPRVESLKVTKDATGKITNTDTSDAENLAVGVPVGTKNSGKMAYQGSSSSDLTVGKSYGATNNDALSAGAAGEVHSDNVDTKPCYTGPGGTDALESNGIKIDPKSVKFELIKEADGSYDFPSCFNALANVFIPANINVADLSANLKVTAVNAGGDMNCDSKVSCRDSSTSNRPPGSCFFCDFCKKEQPQGAFGVGTEANICQAKSGQTLPLKWKLCPPEGSSGKFLPFSPTGQKSAGDIVSVLRLFLRKSKKWEEVACKQSIYSFKVGLANSPTKFGSAPEGKSVGAPPAPGGIPGFDVAKAFGGR